MGTTPTPRRHRRKAGERVAIHVRGRVGSRTAEPGETIYRHDMFTIEAGTDALTVRFGNAPPVVLSPRDLADAAHRAGFTEYDDEFGGPLRVARSVGTGVPGEVRPLEEGETVYGNERFTVSVTARDGIEGPVHISVHDHQRNPTIAWRLLQRIKDEVTGPERWGIEWFPPAAHLIDEANERHVWVLPAGAEPEPWLAILGPRQVAGPEEAAKHGAVQAPLPDWYPEAGS